MITTMIKIQKITKAMIRTIVIVIILIISMTTATITIIIMVTKIMLKKLTKIPRALRPKAKMASKKKDKDN